MLSGAERKVENYEKVNIVYNYRGAYCSRRGLRRPCQ
jgi:hypothetical protein